MRGSRGWARIEPSEGPRRTFRGWRETLHSRNASSTDCSYSWSNNPLSSLNTTQRRTKSKPTRTLVQCTSTTLLAVLIVITNFVDRINKYDNVLIWYAFWWILSFVASCGNWTLELRSVCRPSLGSTPLELKQQVTLPRTCVLLRTLTRSSRIHSSCTSTPGSWELETRRRYRV